MSSARCSSILLAVTLGTILGSVSSSRQASAAFSTKQWIPPSRCVWDDFEDYRAYVDVNSSKIYNKNTFDSFALSIHCPIDSMRGFDSAGNEWGFDVRLLSGLAIKAFVWDASNDKTVDVQTISYDDADNFCASAWVSTTASEYNVFKTISPGYDCDDPFMGADPIHGFSETPFTKLEVHIQLPPQDSLPGGRSYFQGVQVYEP